MANFSTLWLHPFVLIAHSRNQRALSLMRASHRLFSQGCYFKDDSTHPGGHASLSRTYPTHDEKIAARWACMHGILLGSHTS